MTDVLDHGFVVLEDRMGNDQTIARSARVSTGSQKTTGVEKLINYLYEHEHMTPFEHVVFTFHVKAPIFIARQWMRHRTGSFNEISGRYAELSNEFYIPEPDEICTQSTTNKQGKALIVDNPGDCQHTIDTAYKEAYYYYDALLEAGVAREIARIVLPVGIYTEFYWTVNLRNLMHFLKLRLDDHAQYEIRVYAKAISEMVQEVCPLAYNAFMKEKDTND